MKSEWSAENLLFWEEVQRLHYFQEEDKVQRECIRIYEKYFKANSIHELNLPHGVTAQLERFMAQAQNDPSLYRNTVFDEIQSIIFSQMQQNSFIRYKAFLRLGSKTVSP